MRSNTLILLIFTLFFTGCLPRDPRYKNEVSHFYFEPWEPCDVGLIIAQFPPQIDDNDAIIDTPLTVVEMLDIALKNNPTTRATWMQARSNAFFMGMEESTLYPQIDENETLTLNQNNAGSSAASAANNASTALLTGTTTTTGTGTALSNVGGVTGHQSNFTQNLVSELSFSYLVLDFGGRYAAIESARQALIAANWTHNRNLQSVMNLVLNNYYNYLNYHALLLAKDEDIKNAQANFEAANTRHQAGVGILLDVLLAESNLAQAKLQREQLLGQTKIYLGNLAHAMGLPADCKLKVMDLPKDLKLEKVKEGVDCLISTAKLHRPDLASYYALLLEKEADLDLARSNGLPTVNLNGNTQYSNWGHQSERDGSSSTLVLELQIPIFHGFFHEYDRKRAKAEIGLAKANLDAKKSDIILEVVTAYTNFTTSVETYYFSEEYLKYAQEAYDIAYGTYTEGISTILDVLAAQAALSNARAQRIQAQTNWIISLANLAYATGNM